MAEFTLDTSGYVNKPGAHNAHSDGRWTWSGLDPFTQGYIEALFASASVHPKVAVFPWTRHEGHSEPQAVGFSDLAPEALARIIADCARHPNAQHHKLSGDTERQRRAGRYAWEDRNPHGASYGKPYVGSFFPPLTPYLADDGKVHLKERTNG